MSEIVEALTPEQFEQYLIQSGIDEALFAQAFFDKRDFLYKYGHVYDEVRCDHDELPMLYANAIAKANIVIKHTKSTEFIDWNFINDDALSLRKKHAVDHPLTTAIKEFIALYMAQDKCDDRQAFERMINSLC